jgi:zinc transport system ATP-binding protein
MPLISLQNASVRFGGHTALDNISFTIDQGDYIGIIGPNGAGKSTLLKAILGLIGITSGTISVSENTRFGYVPQAYLPKTVFSISVGEVLKMGLPRSSILFRRRDDELLIDKLKTVGLEPSMIKKSFNTLSGGQKQRVIIARALLGKPNVLLFDEPLSGVDFSSKLQIYDLLANINQAQNMTIVFVSHEIETVIEKSKRVLCLNKQLHEGCHPIDFMQGRLHCPLKETEKVTAIHHHH